MAALCFTDEGTKKSIRIAINLFEGNNLARVARCAEQESGMFFNMKYFEDCFVEGDLDKAEAYLSGFATVDANEYSTNLYFHIRWQKFHQALDLKKRQRARKILREEVKKVRGFRNLIAHDTAKILAAVNFRDELEGLAENLRDERVKVMEEVRQNLEAVPSIMDNVVYPYAWTPRPISPALAPAAYGNSIPPGNNVMLPSPPFMNYPTIDNIVSPSTHDTLSAPLMMVPSPADYRSSTPPGNNLMLLPSQFPDYATSSDNNFFFFYDMLLAPLSPPEECHHGISTPPGNQLMLPPSSSFPNYPTSDNIDRPTHNFLPSPSASALLQLC